MDCVRARIAKSVRPGQRCGNRSCMGEQVTLNRACGEPTARRDRRTSRVFVLDDGRKPGVVSLIRGIRARDESPELRRSRGPLESTDGDLALPSLGPGSECFRIGQQGCNSSHDRRAYRTGHWAWTVSVVVDRSRICRSHSPAGQAKCSGSLM